MEITFHSALKSRCGSRPEENVEFTGQNQGCGQTPGCPALFLGHVGQGLLAGSAEVSGPGQAFPLRHGFLRKCCVKKKDANTV